MEKTYMVEVSQPFYPGFVCFVLILGPDIRCAFTGPLVLWLLYYAIFSSNTRTCIKAGRG